MAYKNKCTLFCVGCEQRKRNYKEKFVGYDFIESKY